MLRFVAAFVRTRWLARRLKTRADVERWQLKRIDAWLATAAAKVDFYRGYDLSRLANLPIIDKAVLMGSFERFNCVGVSRDAGFAMLEGGASIPGYSVGASTGTSGNRGLFVISEGERFEWLGVILAKLLPRFPFETARVALILPRDTTLYQAANRTKRLQLRFFDLRRGIDRLCSEIVAYRPDTLIAPPRVLRWLAEKDTTLAPRRVFSCAEVLDPLERAVIEKRFGKTVREIYMATEGLLGVACAQGTLHLAEDAVHFAFEPVAGGDLVSPVISDFTRATQVMARYRLNDLLRLADHPCRCGSPLQAVAEIVGRCDDVIELPSAKRGTVTVTPDVLRNAIVDADTRITDFRLIQTDWNRLRLVLPGGLAVDAANAARSALVRLLEGLDVSPEIIFGEDDVALAAVKLRRVERRWRAQREIS